MAKAEKVKWGSQKEYSRIHKQYSCKRGRLLLTKSVILRYYNKDIIREEAYIRLGRKPFPYVGWVSFFMWEEQWSKAAIYWK